MLARIEEGYSQNFDLLCKASFEALKSPAQCVDLLPSSLPSPPTSTPSLASPTPAKNDPSFASLSSPAESHLFSPCIPDSPDWSSMIADAIRARQGLSSMDGSPSKSSSGSRESVEQQLTQSMDDHPHPQHQPPITNIELQRSQTPRLHVPQKQITSRHRQTWYQARPKTKRKKTSASIPPKNTGTASNLNATSYAGTTPHPSLESAQADSQQFPYQTQASYDSQS